EFQDVEEPSGRRRPECPGACGLRQSRRGAGGAAHGQYHPRSHGLRVADGVNDAHGDAPNLRRANRRADTGRDDDSDRNPADRGL
ncbi:MAG: hypothetical protein AVDCRST_MAG83-469, partial [uncultured Arthrobacter sp.]